MNTLRSDIDVSRETLDAFNRLESLVRKWNPRINLVAKSTLSNFQERHIADAITLVNNAAEVGDWIDLGSGGGFPGLVVAILEGQKRVVKLVESDTRKCAFLMTARRELGLNVEILNDRIEDLEPQRAAVVSARALASLLDLLDLSTRHVAKNGTLLFPKGANWRNEDIVAREIWEYDLDVIKNPVSPGSVILKIRNARRIRQ